MYQSQIPIQKKPFSALKSYLNLFLNEHKKIYCSALGRPVFLDKLPEAILKRKNAKGRLECFFAAVDILKHSKKVKIWKGEHESGFCVIGFSKEHKKVSLHLREEKSKRKDKRLFLISMFYK